MGTEIMTAQIPLTHAGTKACPTYLAGYNTQTYGWLWSPAADFVATTNAWRVDLTGTKQSNIVELQPYANVPDLGQPNNRYARIEIYGVKKDGTGSSPDEKALYLGEYELRSGSAHATDGVLGSTTYRFIDKITVLRDGTNSPPGVRFLGDVDNKAAAMQFDGSAFIALIILVKQGPTDPITILGLFWTVL